MCTDLNEGMGCPCAGQDKQNVSPNLVDKIEPLDLCENFGLAPPIGSI